MGFRCQIQEELLDLAGGNTEGQRWIFLGWSPPVDSEVGDDNAVRKLASKGRTVDVHIVRT